MKNPEFNEERVNSILDLNVPRKIIYNRSFNKSFIENNEEYKSNTKIPKFRKVSKFNPYDIERYITSQKENIHKTGLKKQRNSYCINVIRTNDNQENKENVCINPNLLNLKDNKYLNIKSNKKISQNLMMKFNTPKIGLDLGVTNKNTPEYIKKIKNQKNQYFTDLKKTLNNIKIKSTNYSSNGSNYYNENNYNDCDEDNEIKIKETSFNKNVNKINKSIGKTQILPKALKTLGKYLQFKSMLKNKSKSKNKDNKDKIKAHKSANNLKIANKNKYISTNDFKTEKSDNKNKFSNENENNNKNENNGIRRFNSFLNPLIYCFTCFGNEFDSQIS